MEHGKALIRKYAEVAKKFPEFRCVIKFQYRDIPTFIHPDFKERFDFKYVKRFSETALPEEAFIEMKKCADECGILTACTPFDEVSVDRVIKHGFDFLKIAEVNGRFHVKNGGGIVVSRLIHHRYNVAAVL